MRFWIGVSAAFGAGALIGAGLTRIQLEQKMKKDYEASVASMRRVLLAQKIDAETPVMTEDELDEPLPIVLQRREEGIQLTMPDGELRVIDEGLPGPVISIVEKNTGPFKRDSNPYHQPVADTLILSWAELDEEDYYDEDGREKEQITMVYDQNEPHFFHGGEEIEDWMDRLGGTIVDDMREKVREGTPILWIRNNQTDVDYEVIFEQP